MKPSEHLTKAKGAISTARELTEKNDGVVTSPALVHLTVANVQAMTSIAESLEFLTATQRAEHERLQPKAPGGYV